MTKSFLFGGAVIAVLLIGGSVFALTMPTKTTNTTTKSAATPTPSSQSTQTTPSTPPTAASSPGSYVDYDSGIIQATNGTKILFFHAPWCPQCRKLEQSIKAGTIPSGVTIIKVDYDSNQALRKQYGVTIQTSLVRVDGSGQLQKRYVAYESPTLAAVVKNLLP